MSPVKTIYSYDINSYDNQYKSIYVLWSGGCDSTLVLYNLLKELKKHKNSRTINTYSFSHSQFSEIKMKKENEIRTNFLNYIKTKEFNNVTHTNIPIYDGNIEVNFGSSFSCPQPCLWLSQILPFIKHDSILYTGYHKGDDFFSYEVHSQWLKIFDGMNTLLGSKDITLGVPLVSASKYDIVYNLKFNKIYDYTWHCETPNSDGTECGECLPCTTHKQALLLYKHNKRNKKLPYQLYPETSDKKYCH